MSWLRYTSLNKLFVGQLVINSSVFKGQVWQLHNVKLKLVVQAAQISIFYKGSLAVFAKSKN